MRLDLLCSRASSSPLCFEVLFRLFILGRDNHPMVDAPPALIVKDTIYIFDQGRCDIG